MTIGAMWRVTSVAAVVAAATQSLGTQQQFRSGVEIVSVNVAVLRNRKPVTGLATTDFVLMDNGVRQSVTSSAVETQPIDLTLVIDLGGGAGWVPDHFKADVQKVVRLLRSSDRIRVIQFSTDVREIAPMRAASDFALPDFKLIGGRSYASTDALAYALMVPPILDRRQLVMAYTNGEETLGMIGDDEFLSIVSRADATLYLVPPQTTLVDLEPYLLLGRVQPARQALMRAPSLTGGAVYSHAANENLDVGGVFRDIFTEFRQSYVLRYSVDGVPRGGWHDISVKLVGPGSDQYTVRARKGYFGG